MVGDRYQGTRRRERRNKVTPDEGEEGLLLLSIPASLSECVCVSQASRAETVFKSIA
jgi:hypothetical protein